MPLPLSQLCLRQEKFLDFGSGERKSFDISTRNPHSCLYLFHSSASDKRSSWTSAPVRENHLTDALEMSPLMPFNVPTHAVQCPHSCRSMSPLMPLSLSTTSTPVRESHLTVALEIPIHAVTSFTALPPTKENYLTNEALIYPHLCHCEEL